MKPIPEKILNDSSLVKPAKNLYTTYGKRTLDVILSGVAIVVLAPVLGITAILELIYHGRPVLYHTLRPGKEGKLFKLYKFRSMTNAVDKDGKLLPDKDRITKFGKLIRKTSLDELPELFSIIKGDMSIIGPRPLLKEYMEYYTPRHACRHKVKPGLVCVRIKEKQGDTWTWADQFENDIWYIENLSFKTDCQELLAIIRKVIFPDRFRTEASRVPFMGGETLYETRSNSEVGLENLVFDSVSMEETKQDL